MSPSQLNGLAKMHPRKVEYVNEVFTLTNSLCRQMTDKQESAIPIVLNISADDTREIIKKILIALPDKFFYNATQSMLYDLFVFISKHFVLFQAQENIDEENYAYHLINFINGLSFTIEHRYSRAEV